MPVELTGPLTLPSGAAIDGNSGPDAQVEKAGDEEVG